MFTLTSHQMEQLCQGLQHLVGATLLYCAGENLKRFSFVLQTEVKKENLFFCFDPPFVRFHLSPHLPSKKLAIAKLNDYMVDSIIESIEMVNQDRILKVTLKSPRGLFCYIAELFPKRPNYYITDREGNIVYALHPVLQMQYTPPKQPSHSPTLTSDTLTHDKVEKEYQHLEKEKLKTDLRQRFELEIKKQNKKIKLLDEKLQECRSWQTIQHEGELLKANYASLKRGAPSVLLFDWEINREIEITLDPKKTSQEELSARFKKAKKLHAGLDHLAKQLELAHQELIRLKEKLVDLETSEDLEKFKTEEIPLSSSKHMTQEKSLPYKEFISRAGVKIWVGKNAKANDKLTFSFANGSDWWLHVQGFPGSHVIIKTSRGQEPDQETLQEAMELALKYSKAKEKGEAEICITQRKYLTRLPRYPGKVQVSKHKVAYIRN